MNWWLNYFLEMFSFQLLHACYLYFTIWVTLVLTGGPNIDQLELLCLNRGGGVNVLGHVLKNLFQSYFTLWKKAIMAERKQERHWLPIYSEKYTICHSKIAWNKFDEKRAKFKKKQTEEAEIGIFNLEKETSNREI